MEAADLYKAGYAPAIVRDLRDAGGVAVCHGNYSRAHSGPPKPSEARDILMELGIPGNAIVLPPRIHDNTAQGGGGLVPRTRCEERLASDHRRDVAIPLLRRAVLRKC